MANSSENIVNDKYSKTLYASLGIFIFVLILTIWLYFYNNSLSKKIVNTTSDIAKVDDSIKKINEDWKVRIYNIIKNNTVFIENYKKLSQITDFIWTLNWLSKDYNVSFTSFSYSNATIKTQAVVKNDDISLSSEKLNKFLSDFRLKDDHKFSLSFINNFSWQEQIKFNVEFKIK